MVKDLIAWKKMKKLMKARFHPPMNTHFIINTKAVDREVEL